MGLELTHLPDEIIIRIISQPVLELNTLGKLMHVSRRIRLLALYVFGQYRLPSVQISLTIDQEGKNRIVSTFGVDNIDPTNLSITFNNTGKRPRRYYSNRASPIIRNMIMTDNYSSNKNSSNVKSSSLYDFSSDDSSSYNSNEKEYAAQKESLLTPPCSDTTHDMGNTRSSGGHIVNQKIQKKKEGLYILNVSQNPASWKLCYEITQRQGHEYYVLPSTIKIQLGQLLLLEDTERQKSRKLWPLSIMKWVPSKGRSSLMVF